MQKSNARPTLEIQSLLDTRSLSVDDIRLLFRHAEELRELQARHGCFFDPQRDPQSDSLSRSRVVCCLFLEPSTRTRMSFQIAAYRLGHQVLSMEPFGGSSLSKGETYADTVENIAAMGPDVLVIRYGRSEELDELLPRLSFPVINAGSGTMAHPTQALLDAFTIHRERGQVRGARVLIVGDIRHSRVARSNFDVLKKLGAEIGVCGPTELMPTQVDGVEVFSDLNLALEWCDVYMGLRIQLERHGDDSVNRSPKSFDDYHERFGLTPSRLKILRSDALIMHPGPINHGVEFSREVAHDARNRVLSQVTNGVLVRASILSSFLNRFNSRLFLKNDVNQPPAKA
jgi:aspartate carbamoyltransferase catalytic subunit